MVAGVNPTEGLFTAALDRVDVFGSREYNPAGLGGLFFFGSSTAAGDESFRRILETSVPDRPLRPLGCGVRSTPSTPWLLGLRDPTRACDAVVARVPDRGVGHLPLGLILRSDIDCGNDSTFRRFWRIEGSADRARISLAARAHVVEL